MSNVTLLTIALRFVTRPALAGTKSFVGRDGKTKQIFAKDKLNKQDLPRNVITKLENILIPFFGHVLNIHVQYLTIKEKKQNLSVDEIIIHVDFSENFNYKYNAEIQDFHFGGSRGQVSLHTGVMYYKDANGSLTTKSFCTMSESLEHNASGTNAIWAHLVPVLEIAKQCLPSLAKIHFVSDSPSSQYRNRYIFYMITQFKKQIPNLELCTWNYQEAGHGKRAPDGIGALIKRTADNHVKFGGDVGCFEDFVSVVQKNIKNVDLIVIDTAAIKAKKFPDKVPSFKGTLKVHQAIWSSFLPYSVAFRSLSCFACDSSFIPCEHSKHLGVLSVWNMETVADAEKQILEDYSSTKSPECKELENANSEIINFEIGSMHIDTPTLMNDIGDSFLEEFGEKCDESEMVLCEVNGKLITKMDAQKKVEMKENDESNMILSEVDGKLIPKNEAYKTVTDMNHNSDAMNSSKPPRVNILSQIILKPSSRYNIQIQGKPDKTRNSECMGIISTDMMEMDMDDISKANQKYRYKDFTLPDLQNVYDVDHRCNSDTSNAENSEKEGFMDVESDKSGSPKYDIDTWVVVEYKVKNKTHIYIGKITNVNHETHEYKVMFVKKAQSRAIKFNWPAMSDEDTILESYIIQVLEDPTENRRGEFVFHKLPKLNFK